MNFEDYVSDVMGLHPGLMSSAQRAEARAAYAVWSNKSEARRNWKAGKQVLADRSVAALFGGKALTGSVKQKVWAEKIRAEKLAGQSRGLYEARDEMSEAEAALACDPAGMGRSAHFWIAARDRKPSEIGAFFVQQKRMLADAMALREAGKDHEFAAAAAAYNALTEEWGFTQ